MFCLVDLAGCFSNHRKPLRTLIRRVLRGSRPSRPARVRGPIVDERGPVTENSTQSQTRLNASTRAELLDGYASGVPVRVLAERFGVHRSTVREIAAKAKISPRRRSLSERDAQEATRLYTDGMTLVEVSARLGVGDEAVRAAVVACGGTIRPRGRRPSQLRRPNDH
jgi:hypothetical protein